VTSCLGEFQRGELVACLTPDRHEMARGLVNYGAPEARKIIGQSSERFVDLLGYAGEPELVHRDNLIVLR
jgi:glutamate 5-kinase